jgi:hypothetical protein
VRITKTNATPSIPGVRGALLAAALQLMHPHGPLTYHTLATNMESSKLAVDAVEPNV